MDFDFEKLKVNEEFDFGNLEINDEFVFESFEDNDEVDLGEIILEEETIFDEIELQEESSLGDLKMDIIVEGSGTSDYRKLKNKPKINNVELIDNKTSDELGLQEKGDYPEETLTNIEIENLINSFVG